MLPNSFTVVMDPLIWVSVDWDAIERCAQNRADAKTFNWDEDSSPLGDLETREMARLMRYRQRLLQSVFELFR